MATTKTAAQAQFAARTPAQQAALEEARKAKQAREQAVPLTAPTVQPDAVAEPKLSATERAMAAISALQNLFGDVAAEPDEGAVSFKRYIAAVMASIAVAAPVGYAIGALASYAMVGAFTLTGSVFLVYLIWIVAAILAIYAGIKIGEYVGNYVLSGQIDRDIVAVKDTVFGWFKREPKAVAA